jgi:hypothetical protein
LHRDFGIGCDGGNVLQKKIGGSTQIIVVRLMISVLLGTEMSVMRRFNAGRYQQTSRGWPNGQVEVDSEV